MTVLAADQIPKTPYAIIGGSSTLSLSFPEDLERADTEVLASQLVFQTPYGPSPIFKYVRLDDKTFLTCKMHGWRPNEVKRGVASQQLFWVLQQAGVKKIYAEGGVGSVNHLLELRDLVIPHDYIDRSLRTDTDLGGPYLLVMRQPVCPTGVEALYHAATEAVAGNERHVFKRGIYMNTDGRHFESVAEVDAFRRDLVDMVGQSMCPEVYLAREIGACYARIDMVVNFAEGIRKEWEHKDLSDIFYKEAKTIANILLNALKETHDDQEACGCHLLRKKTLLKDEYREQ